MKHDKKSVDLAEQLLQQKSSVTNTVIQSALQKLEAKKSEEQERQVIQNMERIQKDVNRAVEVLRTARKTEAAAKVYLNAVAAAQQQFLKDADMEQYLATIQVAGHSFNINGW